MPPFFLKDWKKMEKLIKLKLKDIEERENIRILHCVESGNIAWGFAYSKG